MGFFSFILRQLRMTLFSKIMVAEKHNSSLILQMVISKCKNGKPFKKLQKLNKKSASSPFLRRPASLSYFHPFF